MPGLIGGELRFRLHPGSGILGFLWLAVPSVAVSVAGVELWMADPNSQAASVVIGAGTVVMYGLLLALELLAAWKLNVTECTAGGIRTRRQFWTWQCPWPQVSDITVERVALSAQNPWARSKIRAVRVRTTGGRSFLLGAPIHGGFRPDPDFDASVAAIQAYLRSARAGQSGAEVPAPSRRPRTGLAVAGIAVALLLFSAGVIVRLALADGHTPGTVTLPASLLGASRDTSPDAQGTADALAATARVADGGCLAHEAAALYGTAQVGFVVAGGQARRACAPVSADQLVTTFQARGLADAEAFPPGPHGGAEVCASLEVNGTLEIDCTWVDSGTLGSVLFFGGYASDVIGAASMTRTIRTAVEH
jgi:hypothetical protein